MAEEVEELSESERGEEEMNRERRGERVRDDVSSRAVLRAFIEKFFGGVWRRERSREMGVGENLGLSGEGEGRERHLVYCWSEICRLFMLG